MAAESFLEALRQLGYTELQLLSQGNTAVVYSARFQRGGIDRQRVLKVPRDGIPESITTRINTAKLADGREVALSDIVASPHIGYAVDVLNAAGKQISVRDDFGGMDLETHVRRYGPMIDETRFHAFATQFVDTMVQLHDNGIVHRDVKPCNVLRTEHNEAIVIDTQNWGRISEIQREQLPIRGATAYTHPRLLNAIITGTQEKADERTDLFAMGCTLYFALTGKQLFSYRTVEHEQGLPFELVGQTKHIAIERNGHKLTRPLTPVNHDLEVAIAAQQLPKRYRRLIQGMCTWDDTETFANTQEVQEHLHAIGFQSAIKRTAVRGARLIPATLVGAALGIFAVLAVHYDGKENPAPTLSHILETSGNADFLEPTPPDPNDLLPYHDLILQRFDTLDTTGIEDLLHTAEYRRGMDKRIVSAWFHANRLMDAELQAHYKEAGVQRIGPVFVPYHFAHQRIPSRLLQGGGPEGLLPAVQVRHGLTYLQQCFHGSTNVVDVFGNYFTDDTDRIINRANSGQVPAQEGMYSATSPAFRAANMAVVLFHMADEDGAIDTSAIDRQAVEEYRVNARLFRAYQQ